MGADGIFFGLEVFFGGMFTVELVLKIVAVPKELSKDIWNLIDVLVVAFFWVERLSSDLPFPPTLIRMARLARLLRFLRVVKTMRGFASLYLMLQAIKGSVSALGWSSVVLLLGEMTIALALNLFLSDYWEDPEWTASASYSTDLDSLGTGGAAVTIPPSCEDDERFRFALFDAVFLAIEWFYGILFTAELLLK